MVLPFEPVQSKCTWTCHKTSHLIRQFRGKMPPNSCGPRPRHRLCASRCSWNALGHVTRATWYGNLQVKCRWPDVDQDRDTDFVPACAVEMHVHKSHFIPKFTGKMPDDNEQRHKRRAKQRHKRRDKQRHQRTPHRVHLARVIPTLGWKKISTVDGCSTCLSKSSSTMVGKDNRMYQLDSTQLHGGYTCFFYIQISMGDNYPINYAYSWTTLL